MLCKVIQTDGETDQSNMLDVTEVTIDIQEIPGEYLEKISMKREHNLTRSPTKNLIVKITNLLMIS